MSKLIWKDIPAYNGLYQASNTGSIRGLDRIVFRNGTDHLRKGDIMSQIKNSFGYMTVQLTMDGKRKILLTHRLIAAAFIPNPKNKPQVNHKDGNKTNNHISNLEWCTASENVIHANETGLADFKKNRKVYSGEECGASILTEKQVLEIRSKYKPHVYLLSMLAKEYNVTTGTIHSIITKRTWKTI